MKLIVYSRPNCAPCQTLKLWLSRKGIEFEEREPDTSVRILPTVLLGPHKIEGLNISLLAQLLANKEN